MLWVADELANIFFVGAVIVSACPASRVLRGDEVGRRGEFTWAKYLLLVTSSLVAPALDEYRLIHVPGLLQ